MANLSLGSYHLLAFFCSLSLSAEDFISIDCGSSTSYKDENGISWTGDDKYVKTGESRSVQPSYAISHVADTLRVFTNKTKNCYHIDSVKPGRVLVRATFHYGNYDGKSSPPAFKVLFDGNKWGSIATSPSLPAVLEVIYVTKRDSISVCVAQTFPDEFAFISTIEIRSLEMSMYSDVDVKYPLFTRRRLAFGKNATIRFPEDPYDRLWRPADVFFNDMIKVSSNALLSNEMLTINNNPPPAVLKTAATAATTNSSLDFSRVFSYNVPTYINWYFSEVTRLKPNQTRSFYIFKDNLPLLPLVSPPYQNCTEMHLSNITVSTRTTFSLVPAKNSTLPPLVNAMEVFRIGKYPLRVGTNKKDVQGLTSLQEAFSVLQEWSGDPCLPPEYSWDWVTCFYDTTPRVTSLNLDGYSLSGLLPDFSSMDALQAIVLQNNSLQGNVPDFLGTLPNLQLLNLENNKFNGTVPTSLSTKTGLIVQVDGNPELCKSKTSCSTQAPVVNFSFKKMMKNLEMFYAFIIYLILHCI